MTIGKYLLPFITLPYLARVLTPPYYGIISYMTSILVWIQAIVDFGYNYSATREAAIQKNDRDELGRLLSKTICSKLILSAVCFFILIFMVPFVRIMKENLFLSFIYFISVVITAFIPDFIYRGLEKMEIISIRFIIARLVSTVSTFIFIKCPKDILLVPIFVIFGNVVAVVFSFWHLVKVEIIKPQTITLKSIRDSLIDSSPFFIAGFATTVYGAISVFFMGVKDLSTTKIAYWNISLQIINAIVMLYDPIISSIYPHMVNHRDYRLIKKLFYIFFPIVLIGTIIIYIFANIPILIIGGKNYVDAVSVFRLLLPVLFFSFPTQLLGFPVLAPMNKEKYASLSTVLTAGFHIIGLLFLMLADRFCLTNCAILYSCSNGLLCALRVFIYFTVAYKNKARTHDGSAK